MLFHQTVDGCYADSVVIPGPKESAIVRQDFFVAFNQVVVNGLSARSPKIDHPFLVSFANHTNAIFIDVGEIEPHQFAASNATIEKKHQNRVIPFLIGARDGF